MNMDNEMITASQLMIFSASSNGSTRVIKWSCKSINVQSTIRELDSLAIMINMSVE